MRALIITLLLLSGCAQTMQLEVTKAVITVVPDVKFNNTRQHGRAFWYDVDGVRYCTIMLAAYPAYLGHEAAHCFSGKWHNGVNGEDF